MFDRVVICDIVLLYIFKVGFMFDLLLENWDFSLYIFFGVYCGFVDFVFVGGVGVFGD